MLSLYEYIYEDKPLYYESYYNSVYKKINIYNRNIQFINEGYNKSLPTEITFSLKEQKAISEMLHILQFNILENYFNSNQIVTEGLGEKFKELLNKGTEKVEEFIKDLIEKIPENVKSLYEKISELAKKGISSVKDLLSQLYKIFSSLGETLSDALDKLGLYKDSYVNDFKNVDIKVNIPDELLGKDEDKKITNKFLISQVIAGVQNKSIKQTYSVSENIQEGKLGKVAAIGGAIAVSQFSILPIILVAGGYLTYKTLKFIGPKLSAKLEPILLSDKTKELANKLYDNPISKYGLGLSKKNDIEKEDSKLKKFFLMAKSILVNLVISYLIAQVVGLFISGILGGVLAAGTCAIIVASILAVKNISKTIINRILNFKKETKTKDGKTITNEFFDIMTLVSILSSLGSVALSIPAVKEFLCKAFNWCLNTNLSSTAKADTVNGFSVKDGEIVDKNDIPAIVQNKDENYILFDKHYGEYFNPNTNETVSWNDVADISDGKYLPKPLEILYGHNKNFDFDKVKNCANGFRKLSNLKKTLDGTTSYKEAFISFFTTKDNKVYAVCKFINSKGVELFASQNITTTEGIHISDVLIKHDGIDKVYGDLIKNDTLIKNIFKDCAEHCKEY